MKAKTWEMEGRSSGQSWEVCLEKAAVWVGGTVWCVRDQINEEAAEKGATTDLNILQ